MELKKLHDKFLSVIPSGKPFIIRKKNLDFHYLIFKYNTNREAMLCYDASSGPTGTLGVIINKFGFSEERMKDMAIQHGEYIELIEKKDMVALEDLTKRHAQGAMRDVLARMESQEKREHS
jgi:DNA-binding GntR family transcriptional regulator